MKGQHILEYLQRDASAFNIDDLIVMLGRETLLTHEEELPLIAKAQQGDDKAMTRLLTANIRFVVALARQYTVNRVPLQQLIQAGVSGLEQVIKEYDPASGQQLFKFAVPALRDELYCCVRAHAPKPPKRETPPGARPLKGIIVRTTYGLPKIDEYLQQQPFVLEDFLLTACDVELLVLEDEKHLIDEVLSIADGRNVFFPHRFYERFTKDAIKRDVARYGIAVEEQDFEDEERFQILCQKVVSKRQDACLQMSELKWLYAPRIVVLAEEYRQQGVALEKLISCGLNAFGEAVKQYDTSETQNVLSFATPQIREAMQSFVGQ